MVAEEAGELGELYLLTNSESYSEPPFATLGIENRAFEVSCIPALFFTLRQGLASNL